VASVLAGVLVTGLYRSEWPDFSTLELSSIARGATLGLAATFVLSVWGPLASGDRVATFVVAWAVTIVAMAATRVFVNLLDSALRGGAGTQSSAARRSELLRPDRRSNLRAASTDSEA
jgi:hypothetical protein